jgi:hypothetical protein
MKNLFKYISLFIITLVMSSATASADYQKGIDAYNAGDYATAMKVEILYDANFIINTYPSWNICSA